MQTPAIFNWDLARTMFFQGFATDEILLAAGVKKSAFHKRKKRENWPALRDKITAATSTVEGNRQDAKAEPRIALAIVGGVDERLDRGMVLRSKLGPKLAALIDQLPQNLPKSARDLRDTCVGVNSIIQGCKLVEGWQEHHITVLDIDQLGRDHREIVVTPIHPEIEAPAVAGTTQE